MISVGIDVAKEKSTVCFLKPGGEVVKTPYDVMHNKTDLAALVGCIKSSDEEVRVVLEDTGHYHFPVVKFLVDNGYTLTKVKGCDMFPHTTHVETVALLTKLKESDSITVELDLDELEVSAPKIKATYNQIKEYVLNKYGFKVSSLNIAQVKQECGITESENYNKPSNDYKQPKCPKHKSDAIKDAFRHFGMI